ncbi:MAG: uroporphyrinogen-III C-methyltransferase [Sedimenticolaceae bacterium]
MTHEEPKPGIVIDVSPDHEATAADHTEPATRTPTEKDTNTGRGRNPALVLAAVALLAVVAAGGYGYRHWSNLRLDVARLDSQLREARAQQQQLQQALAEATDAVGTQANALSEQRALLARQQIVAEEARDAFTAQERQLAEQSLRLQQREAELRAIVADIRRRVGSSGTRWMIAESEFLLRIASNRLILTRDVATARIALELADQRLRDTQDPGWAGVRAQIARDIAQLNAFEAPEIAGISARLSGLIAQVPGLRIAGAPIAPEHTLPERDAGATDTRNWETLLDDLWSGFKDIVRIRVHDQPVEAMIAPEQQFLLYENLKLHLEVARLGLARHDPRLFRDNLATASDWLGRYFDANDATVAAVKQAIAALGDIDIAPEMPDITGSLRALTAQDKLMQDVAAGAIEAP